MDFTLSKRNYYCLISGLPDIILEDTKTGKGGLSLKFKTDLSEQLHPNDYELAKLLYLHYDNKNLQNLLFRPVKPFSILGNYSQAYLIEQINEPERREDYIFSLINSLKDESFSLDNVNVTQSWFYSHVLKTKNSFLKRWFTFDKDMKNILTAVNCKKYKYNSEQHLISVKNSNDVYNILVKNGPKEDLLTDELAFADEIIQIAESDMDITAKEKALDLIKWKFLDESIVFSYFTIEKILVYILKLEMLERWREIDDETGKAFFSKLVHDLKSGYAFTEEFSLTKRKIVDNN
ncbi:DUF2764 family protein [Ancylomarina sp.]|uniref:DUF2764 family protein n=1 Tax=Ancylomarina sp. TaxID=1970196 RepID=UPI0035621512